MEWKEQFSGSPPKSLLEEVFAATDDNGQADPNKQAQAVRELHARLSSTEFAVQMTGIFFNAKRAALAKSD